ncbi:MAG: glycosyltransferase [Gomphosphaeria aponina SAG 52.96 = DSM 107014]|uniref:Glycosyltransferase n=1 Tax=Gomphosphaeria aponina SAG 52.96 = DSM 107014 TaxID=1521640 RepID=A0A941JQV9_9CHRO|nr:glycosyltransferase [Gomphosphaeria aponina SAG 52.96 = DSM 107014]
MTKIIHLPFCFYPDPMGGTEVYVEALARELTRLGIINIICAPSASNQAYTYNQLSIRRFALNQEIKHLKEIYGEGDEKGALEFTCILETEKPDLIHLHAFTRGVSLKLVRIAKAKGIPVIFTYHTPTVSCQRGTLLRWGEQICDGKIELSKCTACTLHSLGVNPSLAQAITNLPPIVSQAVTKFNLQGGIWTALQMSELVKLRSQALQNLMKEVDHIIAVCDWVKDVLTINQVPPDKITVIRQGLCQELPQSTPLNPSQNDTQPLRLVFFGRVDRTKGIHIVLNALATNPNLNVRLDIYGICQGDSSYQQQIKKLIEKDKRVFLKNPVPSSQVVETMRNYDMLVVPSQWLETGPMVILEAFAAQIPVIGSNLGGIAELVRDNVNGVLVEASCLASWARVIQSFCEHPEKIEDLRSGISVPMMMDKVAERMKVIYNDFSN